MAKSVPSKRSVRQQQVRQESASDIELKIPLRRRRLTSDTDGSVVNRSGYYTASDAEPESSTTVLPPHHILIEPPASPEPNESEAVYPAVDNFLEDSNIASGNHTYEIEKDG